MTRLPGRDAPPIGIGQRGEIETKAHTAETQVTIPWILAHRTALAFSLLYLGIWAIVFLAWWGKSPPKVWWHFFFSTKWGWWAWFLPRLPYILIPVVPIYTLTLAFLAIMNYVPKMINDNWPYPYAQANPKEMGFHGAWDMPRTEETEEQLQQKIVIEGVVSNGHGDDVRTRFETLHPGRWKRYLSALVMRTKALRPHFSVESATSPFFSLPEKEFKLVSDQWLRIGYARATSDAPNAKRYLTGKGEAFARGWRDGHVQTLLPDVA